MQWLIVLVIVVFGLLHVFVEQVEQFKPSKVDVVQPVTVPVRVPVAAPQVSDNSVVAPITSPGNYSMPQRYQLFISLGASVSEAVLLTAICTAENGSGSPTAINHNRSAPDDVGLCQINASHVPALAPSYESLKDPVINASVALRMLRAGGPKQWCTYPGGCGGLPGVPNFSNLLGQAQAIAETNR